MKKFQATKVTISNTSSAIFALVALIFLFSPNTVFEILSVVVTTAFGFVGFWVLLPFIVFLSIYSILNKKIFKIKSARYIIAVIIGILITLIVLSNSKDLTFQNASQTFKSINADKTDSYLNTALGGGYVGFVLAGALNTFVTPLGTNIVCLCLAVIALLIVVLKPLIKLIKFAKKSSSERKAKKEALAEEQRAAVEIVKVDEEVPTVEETPKEFKPYNQEPLLYQQTNINTPLKKARFVPNTTISPLKKEFVEEQKKEIAQPVIEEAPVAEAQEPYFEEPKQEELLAKPRFEESSLPPVSEKEPEEVNIESIDFSHRPQPKYKPVTNYTYPGVDLLLYHENPDDAMVNEASCAERTEIINQTFTNFRVGASVVGHTVGPAVTRFDIKTNYDVSVNSLTRYIDDIAVHLGGKRIRFETIVFGKATSGLEVPNEKRTNVGLREALEKMESGGKYNRYIPFGKNISGDLLSADFTEFPHMLVSGTTGSGKTIFMHSVILSLIMRNKPEELKILLIDPKKVEMTFYEDIPHLLCPNITDAFKANAAFRKLVDEMERRYNLFGANRVRDIKGFNEWARSHDVQPLPYIAVFVDEYADLVDTCKEIRDSVQRIVQKARAAGIHLILATQRPSVNVIDGVIKGNIATRVALLSASATDSCVVIGEGGAEKLLGNGDMLVESALLSTVGKPRVQGCFVEVSEIMDVCDFLRNQYGTQYDPNFMNLDLAPITNKGNEVEMVQVDKNATEEAQYQQIKEQICNREYCSISFIQRSFGLGFPKAGRFFARLIKEGLVANDGGDHNGSKVLAYKKPEQQIGSVEQSTYYPDDEYEN